MQKKGGRDPDYILGVLNFVLMHCILDAPGYCAEDTGFFWLYQERMHQQISRLSLKSPGSWTITIIPILAS